MTRFDDLDRALTAYFDIEAVAPAPDGLLESAMATTARRQPRPAWLARARAGSVSTPRSETTRTLLIAAALVALLLLIVGFALLGGGGRTPPPFADTSPSPVVSAVADGGPVEESLRATWIGNTRELPLLGTGAGPVSMTISSSGTGLSASNFAPGATFDSTISNADATHVHLVLDRASGGCEPGAVGTYFVALSDEGSHLDLVATDDECATRAEALTRTWGRSLLGDSSRGSGYVTSIDPPFSVDLPDQRLSSRTLDDMVEIGGENGFSLMGFRNPQGFVDPCSTAQERYPYEPGADAFADFLEQNPGLDVVSRTELTIDGKPAIHVVTQPKADLGDCENAPDGLYLWTPKDCECHFIGGHDSLYLVDVDDETTLMFEVSPVDETNPVERQVIDSIRIPAQVPSD